MMCQACGNPVGAEVHFCPRCGAQVVAAPPPNRPLWPPVYPPMYAPRCFRVQRNLQVLGTLWCVFGVFRIIGGVFAMTFLRMSHFSYGAWGWGWHRNIFFWPPWINGTFPLVMLTVSVLAILALVAGYGLLTRRPWARMLTIVLAILALLKFPVGTALGIYTLWVLAPAESRMEYESIADHSGF